MTKTFADLGALKFEDANWPWNDWSPDRLDTTITLGTSRTAGTIFALDGTRLDTVIGPTRYTTRISGTRLGITITTGTSRISGTIFALDGTRPGTGIGSTRYTTTIAPTIQHRKAQ